MKANRLMIDQQRFFGRAFVVMAGVCAAAPLMAQVVRPDAGTLQRDLDQRPLQVPRAGPQLKPAPARPALQGDATTRFRVAGLRVTGNTVFTADTLLALVKDDLVGKQVTLAELQAAANKISVYYRDRGYFVARAYIPAQELSITGGEVEIAVLEGVLGGLRVQNRSRLSDAAVGRFLAPLKTGEIMSADVFERPILLLSDQAGVSGVNPVLEPGAQTGSSDLSVEVGSAPLVTGSVELDSWGSRVTGKNRLSGQINLLSPFGLGDSLTVRVTDSFAGISSGSVRAAVPLGGSGLKAGLGYSATRYSLGQEFANLNATGDSRNLSSFVSYPLVRSQGWNLNAMLAYEDKRLEDRVGATATVTPKSNRASTLTLSGDVRDPLVVNSVLVWNAAYSGGSIGIGEAAANAADATSARTQGSYDKFNASMLYLQALGSQWTFYFTGQVQVAGKNLDSSEKFSLGGAQGVRSYPSGEASGDEGASATVEMRYGLPQWLGATPSLVLFVDHGHVRINKNPFATGRNSRDLGAAGIGVTFVKEADFALRAFWGKKTTGDPATADNDRSGRGWVQMVKYF